MLYNDISDNYRNRDYVVEYTLQKGYYRGHLYVKYACNGFGLKKHNFEDFETIHMSDFIENDCEFKVSDDESEVLFKLVGPDGDKIEVKERADKLSNYLVGINIISCEGTGKKKERRRCSSCKHFNIIHNDKTIKGYCVEKERSGVIYGSSIICAFGYGEL